MQPPPDKIRSHMQVISADGRRAGYVERTTDAEIITMAPCRHIALATIRRVTTDVHIQQRYGELEESLLLPLPGPRIGF